MDCVALAILVNESKYRPLITCFAESAFFFFMRRYALRENPKKIQVV
jgi:hypothetical protein